jgi:hypothetical protein
MMAPALFFLGNEKIYGGPAAKNFGPLECLPPLRMELANFLGRKKCQNFPRKTRVPWRKLDPTLGSNPGANSTLP